MASTDNITQFTPSAVNAIDATIKAVRATPKDRRSIPNPVNSVGRLPPGTGQYKVLMLLDNTDTPAKGWDYPRFY